ncbi:MAG TPA: phosphoribosyltransferase family protein [Stellaceae bacterium]|jgi:putative phosphoribosyl transferase|nr:phosphoribosyltransferase family protein [Stellaceae bacterium]
MAQRALPYRDRHDAGKQLADRLSHYASADTVVLAIPRGGVPVGFEIARRRNLRLDLLMARKLGAPGNPELGLGAVVDSNPPQMVLDSHTLKLIDPSPDYIETEKKRQLEEIARRRKAYMGDRPALRVQGSTAIVVDDGIATGSTMKVALKALRLAGASRLVVAVPVGPYDVIETLRRSAEVVCLDTPPDFHAVSMHYRNFDQITDEEVVELLRCARAFGGAEGAS